MKKENITTEEVKEVEEVKEIDEVKEIEVSDNFDFKKIKSDRYFEAVGKRKTAAARVRLQISKDHSIIVNDKDYKEYFLTLELQNIVLSALKEMDALDKFNVSIKIKGGGIHAQAEAVRHGIARILIDINPNFRKKLRRIGYLTRDPRMRERKKFGLKRARKAPQWAKR